MIFAFRSSIIKHAIIDGKDVGINRYFYIYALRVAFIVNSQLFHHAKIDHI